jgi:tRNA threonylcarbamoyladenosine biosynthesis protein TsaE
LTSIVTIADLDSLQGICCRLASELQAGDCLLLHGPMGSGKTQFVKFIIQALGSQDPVTSPTYGLANFYQTNRMPVLHVDTYRLSGVEEYRQLGLDEYYDSHLILVEWGEMVRSDFEDPLDISFAIAAAGSREVEPGETHEIGERAITMSWRNPRWSSVAVNASGQTV